MRFWVHSERSLLYNRRITNENEYTNMQGGLRRDDILHPEISYQIVGAAYEVFNQLGPGLKERTYEEAFAQELQRRHFAFVRQHRVPIKYFGVDVGTHILDFLVERIIIVELKVGDYFPHGNIQQIAGYLERLNLELGIIINFTRFGVRQKRILRPDSSIRPHS